MSTLHWPRLLPGEVFSEKPHGRRSGGGFGAGSLGSLFNGDGYGDGVDGTPRGNGYGCGYGTHSGTGKGGLDD